MNAWLKRKKGADEVVSVLLDAGSRDAALVYHLHTAYDQEYLGRILFDNGGFWIYDGDELSVDEQEQLGRFIQYHLELICWHGRYRRGKFSLAADSFERLRGKLSW